VILSPTLSMCFKAGKNLCSHSCFSSHLLVYSELFFMMQVFHIFQLVKRRPLHKIVSGKLYVYGVLRIGGNGD